MDRPIGNSEPSSISLKVNRDGRYYHFLVPTKMTTVMEYEVGDSTLTNVDGLASRHIMFLSTDMDEVCAIKGWAKDQPSKLVTLLIQAHLLTEQMREKFAEGHPVIDATVIFGFNLVMKFPYIRLQFREKR